MAAWDSLDHVNRILSDAAGGHGWQWVWSCCLAACWCGRWLEIPECVGQFDDTKACICVAAVAGDRRLAPGDGYLGHSISHCTGHSKWTKFVRQTTSFYLALQLAHADVGCKQRTEGRHEAEIKLYPRLSPGWQLMFIYPTDGVIASMISTQTRMTDSEHSSQLFIHAGGKHALPAQPSTCTGCQDRSCARAAGGSKIW